MGGGAGYPLGSQGLIIEHGELTIDRCITSFKFFINWSIDKVLENKMEAGYFARVVSQSKMILYFACVKGILGLLINLQ